MTRRLFRPLLLVAALGMSMPAAAVDCVVLLHGLARTERSMALLEQAFIAGGYAVANVSYDSREHPVRTLADAAIPAGIATCAARDPGRVHFVTHSLGGILLRDYLVRHEFAALGRVVMLAPPNQGSESVDRLGSTGLFASLMGPAALELGTGDSALPRLLGPVTYSVGVIAGTRTIDPIGSMLLPDPDDGKVSLQRTKIEGMADFLVVPVSHSFIMRDAGVIRQALAFIATGAFDHGTGGAT